METEGFTETVFSRESADKELIQKLKSATADDQGGVGEFQDDGDKAEKEIVSWKLEVSWNAFTSFDEAPIRRHRRRRSFNEVK